jgi:hypothetical protein
MKACLDLNVHDLFLPQPLGPAKMACPKETWGVDLNAVSCQTSLFPEL